MSNTTSTRGGHREGAGRPAGSIRKETRTQIYAKITASEKAQIEAYMRQNSMSLSDVVRDAVLSQCHILHGLMNSYNASVTFLRSQDMPALECLAFIPSLPAEQRQSDPLYQTVNSFFYLAERIASNFHHVSHHADLISTMEADLQSYREDPRLATLQEDFDALPNSRAKKLFQGKLDKIQAYIRSIEADLQRAKEWTEWYANPDNPPMY